MPEGQNSVTVALPDSSAPVVVQPGLVAVGAPLTTVRRIVQLQADEHAPHFPQGQEPLEDGRIYRGVDGQDYYRPDLLVSRSPTAGPNVRFLRDAQGKIRLEFELEDRAPAGAPAEAQPFNVAVGQVALQWVDRGQSKSRTFQDPTRTAADGSGGPRFVVRVGADLAADEVAPLLAALRDPDAKATVSVALSYGYWVDAAPAQPTGPATVSPAIRRVVVAQPEVVRRASAEVSAAPLAEPRVIALKPLRAVLSPAVVSAVLEQAKAREQQPNFKRVELARTVPFTFLPTLPENRRVYGVFEGHDALAERWEASDWGWIRGAPFANTVYRVPDEVRLAYNAELGVPHFLPVLYREGQDEQGDVRVRVVLRAEPWHDPEKLVKLRDGLHAGQPGLYAAPAVVAGGWEQATLKLTGAFPEQLHVVDGNAIAVSLERGFEIRLDLTLEFYKFLCQVMTNAPGLTGEVQVTLDTTPPDSGAPAGTPAKTRTDFVPVRLTLDDLARLPVDVAVAGDAISPRELTIGNRAAAGMRIRACAPRLVQQDHNSAVPLDVYEASAETPFPATVASGASLGVRVAPKDPHPDQVWNAVHVELIGQELLAPADQTLTRIYEVLPQNTLPWTITVECPVFLQDPVPTKFQNLYRVEVKITRQGYAAQQVVLRKGQATGRVTMERTLRDLLSAEGAATFSYRVRNIYFDHEGRWSDERVGEGSSIVVFPNPLEND